MTSTYFCMYIMDDSRKHKKKTYPYAKKTYSYDFCHKELKSVSSISGWNLKIIF